MPRECTHWKVLEETVLCFEKEGFFKLSQVIKNNLDKAKLGAISYDAPYFHLFGFSATEEISNLLHGSYANDTFDAIRLLSKEVSNLEDIELRKAGWSFLIGALSHIAVDNIFHPAIFYYTGNYNHQDMFSRKRARAYHVRLENHLDNYFNYKNNSILSICKGEKKFLSNFSIILNRVWNFRSLGIEEFSTKKINWKSCFYFMGILQKVFSYKVLTKTLYYPAKYIHYLRHWHGLFARKDSLDASNFFRSNLNYQNPITGIEDNASFDDLLIESKKIFLDWCKSLEMSIDENFCLIREFPNGVGRNLNFNEEKVSSDIAKYFSKRTPDFLIEFEDELDSKLN